ncbi:hypothetical protein HD593_008285 [Nonomuraea rubra]|uniref:Uncharacterized protein n=1 Tax=Nonomuraea rubra TaxID=46180 RepID=A0A7X0P1D6_9ACTN|nr:hypothetical protein [Nonomuraea rubra]
MAGHLVAGEIMTVETLTVGNRSWTGGTCSAS